MTLLVRSRTILPLIRTCSHPISHITKPYTTSHSLLTSHPHRTFITSAMSRMAFTSTIPTSEPTSSTSKSTPTPTSTSPSTSTSTSTSTRSPTPSFNTSTTTTTDPDIPIQWTPTWIRQDQPIIHPIPWTYQSRRTGVIATKMGMMSIYDAHGRKLPITVVRIDSQVTQVGTTISTRTGRVGLQMGGGVAKLKRLSKALIVHYKKNGIEPKQYCHEFQVTPDAILPVATRMSARHFLVGQLVDVQGTTIGKGFAGGMKRWGFGGQPASHGVSVSHRSIGSTGAAQTPGHVFKNKKMPGHMGNTTITTQNLRVYKIDYQRDLLFLIGAVPGYKGNWVHVSDAVKRSFDHDKPPPFPTHIPTADDAKITEAVMEPTPEDPFAYGDA